MYHNVFTLKSEYRTHREDEQNPNLIENVIKGMTYLEQFVDRVVDFTSKYNSELYTSYSPFNLLGKYTRYPSYGDFPETYTLRHYGKWWQQSASYQKNYMLQDTDPLNPHDYVTVHFSSAVLPRKINIYETYSPGSIVRIWGRLEQMSWHLLWQGPPQLCANEVRKFSPKINKLNRPINEIRLELNSSFLNHYPCIDAILLGGYEPKSSLQHCLLANGITDSLNVIQTAIPKDEACEYSDKNIDLFLNLPYEVIIYIFQHLDLKSLSRCALVNKRWNQATLDPVLYQNLSLKRYWHKINCNTLSYFMKRCKNLKKLDLSWCCCQGEEFQKLFIVFLDICCKNITHLSLGNCLFVNNICIEKISQCCDLVDLRLRNTSNVSSFVPLQRLKKLMALDLYSSKILDDDLIMILKSNAHLEHLNIDFCENLEKLDDVTEILAQYNRHIMSWSSWKTRFFTFHGISHLGICRRLRELDLGFCLLLHDPGDCLERIATGCTDLERLIISGWRGVNDQHLLPVLNNCKSLAHLDIAGIKSLSRDVIKMALYALPKLKLLEISFCDAVSLELVSMWKVQFPFVCIQKSSDYDLPDFMH